MNREILVTRSSMPSLEEYVAEIEELWDSHWLTNMGAKHIAFQDMLRNYLKIDNIELLTNGHMALELTLQALNLSGEVITTPYTFASTTHAIVRNGLVPKFCDIDYDTYTIDVDKLESLITERTCAILPVHVYGNVCNVTAIKDIADKYGLKVVYDAAHAFGEEYNGRGIAEFGDASCFSFHATKVFNTIEGGAVAFHDKNLGEKLYDLKNFGIHGPEDVDAVGANAKMNEFCAAMGICNLRHIEEEINKRERIDTLYRQLLSDVEGIKLNVNQPGLKRNYSYFPIVVEEEKLGITRDELFNKLKENNIVARKYFYPITSDFKVYRHMFDAYDTPIALRVSRRVLTLPMYADLELDIVERICRVIKEACNK